MRKFAVCKDNTDHTASLIVGKIYQVMPDVEAAKHDLIRVIDEDESENDGYLYPKSMFVALELPENRQQLINRAGVALNAEREVEIRGDIVGRDKSNLNSDSQSLSQAVIHIHLPTVRDSIDSNATKSKSSEARMRSRSSYPHNVFWGESTDIPVPADYDGDGKTELVVYRPTTCDWYILNHDSSTYKVQWGQKDDEPVPADYDGDGKTEIAVWRPSDGNWYFWHPELSKAVVQWGQTGDVPVPADYNGDGKAEIAIWRPTEGAWYVFNGDIPWGNVK